MSGSRIFSVLVIFLAWSWPLGQVITGLHGPAAGAVWARARIKTRVKSSGSYATRAPEYSSSEAGVDVQLCYGWSCTHQVDFHWKQRSLDHISGKIAHCATSAENEILALRNAIRDVEKAAMQQHRVLRGDIAGNIKDRNHEGRMDCVDNSSNTNAFLHVLQDNQPFRFWKVDRPRIDGWVRLHQTATVRTRDPVFIEKYRDRTRMGDADSTVWVVDSWLTSFGHKPFLFELNDWRYKLDPWSNRLYYPMYKRELACW